MLKVSSRLKYLEYSIIFLSVTFVVSLNYRIPGADRGLYNQGCAVTEGIN